MQSQSLKSAWNWNCFSLAWWSRSRTLRYHVTHGLYSFTNICFKLKASWLPWWNDKKGRKKVKRFFPTAGFEPTTGQGSKWLNNFHKNFDRLNQKTLKNHISFWVSHFQYMNGTLGSALNWIFTWYHPYTGSGTPRRKYDFISKILLSKNGIFW